MNRYYYINNIYNYFKKDWSKETPEKEVKKSIEEWLMYEYHGFGGGGEPVEWLDTVSGKTIIRRYTLPEAGERVVRHILCHGVQYYDTNDWFLKWIKKKKNRELLKLN